MNPTTNIDIRNVGEATLDVSIVVAVYNEEESLPELCRQLDAALTPIGKTYEVILVDDGSRDRSWEVMQQQAALYKNFVLIRFRRNFGQTPAMSAGFDASRGEVVITMDADLQNDPADIPLMLENIDKGFDVVSGWRKYRQDRMIDRKIPSMIANRLIGHVTGVRLHDFGCSLKAYRRAVVKNIRLYGEMHRFVPALASWVGAKITEVPVQHHARQFGKSKYGISRTLRVVLDLMTVNFLLQYSTRPIQFFGKIGMRCAGIAFFILGVVLIDWILGLCGVTWFDPLLVKRPIWIASPLILVIVSAQFITLGLMAELQSRTYYESQNKPIYTVKEIRK